MATYTKNYNLIKPSGDDCYDIEDINKNSDAIDNQLSFFNNQIYNINISLEEIKEKINENLSYITENKDNIENHIADIVGSDVGTHGFRFFNNQLEYFNGRDWSKTIGAPPNNVDNLDIKIGNSELTIYWSDPEDTVFGDNVISKWKGTKLIKKVGSFPTSVNDGILVIDNHEKNKYKDKGITINNLIDGVEYFFQLFPYSDTGFINSNESNKIRERARKFRKMTLNIDLKNPDPESCITYEDDAVNMNQGSSLWDIFFGYKPCLFKDGKVVGYLDKNNFAKFEDGTDADITSGDCGDVMIEFPKLGINITSFDNQIKLSVTNNPQDLQFLYYAHERFDVSKKFFYMASYQGHCLDDRLRSISGKTVCNTLKRDDYRTKAQANGNNYEMFAYYQIVFIQCLYLLKYKNLNSQLALGKGDISNISLNKVTGTTNMFGMNYGRKDVNTESVKIFGLENFWGMELQICDGVFLDEELNVFTTNDKFGNSRLYTKKGKVEEGNGFVSKVVGTNELGFLGNEFEGSSNTYFCDIQTYSLNSNKVGMINKSDENIEKGGIFYMMASENGFASRLMYL